MKTLNLSGNVLLLLLAGSLCLSCDGRKKVKTSGEAVISTADIAALKPATTLLPADSTTVAADSCRRCFEVITEIPYDIPAQRFDVTAQALAHATGCFIETDLGKTGAVKVNAVKGKISIRDAVRMAIKGTRLKITEETPTKLTVVLAD